MKATKLISHLRVDKPERFRLADRNPADSFGLDVENPLSVRRTEQPSAGAACFGSGSLTMHMFMADVLRFLPVKVDSANAP